MQQLVAPPGWACGSMPASSVLPLKGAGRGTQELWTEGVTGKRARKASVVSSPIQQRAPMVKRARSRHSTPMSARKPNSYMHGSQAAATSRCG